MQAHGQAEHRPAAQPACWGANKTLRACPGAAASGAGAARPAADVHVHVNPTPPGTGCGPRPHRHRHRGLTTCTHDHTRQPPARLLARWLVAEDRALRRSRCVAAPGPLLAGRCQCTKKQARPAASRSARLGAPCMSEFPLAGLQQAVLRARLCSCTGPSAAGLSLKTQCPVGSCIMFISI